MKKILFSLVMVATLGLSNAQSNANAATIAKKAAKEAGCLDAYSGPLETRSTVIGTCASGPAETSAMTEVLVLPKVNPKDAPYVRVAPLARVTMCGIEVLSVGCTF